MEGVNGPAWIAGYGKDLHAAPLCGLEEEANQRDPLQLVGQQVDSSNWTAE